VFGDLSDNSHYSKCYKITGLTDEEATLLEPASCAVHGIDKIQPKFGSTVLLIGAGPTGLILAQLLKVRYYGGVDERDQVLIPVQLAGASKVTIAANKGIKMDLARKLNAGDDYLDLDRTDAKNQWAQLKKDNPRESIGWMEGIYQLTISTDGFDIVAECTGVESIVGCLASLKAKSLIKQVNDSINYVARGGTLLVVS
jgi:D-arabinitol dehydrogenase (NADP+)